MSKLCFVMACVSLLTLSACGDDGENGDGGGTNMTSNADTSTSGTSNADTSTSGTSTSGTSNTDTSNTTASNLPDTSTPAGAWAVSLVGSVCEKRVGCCPDAPAGAFDDECEILGFALTYELDNAVSSGWASFDEAAAATCLMELQSAIEAASCEDFSVESLFDGLCEDAIVPQVAEGGVCGTYEEQDGGSVVYSSGLACQGDLVCIQTEEGSAPTCQQPAALGSSCEVDIDSCVDEAFCNDSNVCTGLLAEGESCGWSDQCQSGSCNDDGVCVAPNTESLCTPLFSE